MYALLLAFKPPAKRGAASVPLSSATPSTLVKPRGRSHPCMPSYVPSTHSAMQLGLCLNITRARNRLCHQMEGGRPLAGTATITHPARSPTLVFIRRGSHDSCKYWPARLIITNTFIPSTNTKRNLSPSMKFHLLFPGLRIGGHRRALPLSVHVEHCTVAKSTEQRGRALAAMDGRGGTPGDAGGALPWLPANATCSLAGSLNRGEGVGVRTWDAS